MPEIIFNAFSFLQKKLRDRDLPFSNVKITIEKGTTPKDLIKQMALKESDVEVVFINGKVGKFDTPLADSDRVAFVPQGTPGPYRVLLGFKRNTAG